MEAATPIAISFVASFYLLAVLTLTSFIKVTVVLLILRNALGLQQVPSNMIVMALALFLSAFISAPIFTESAQAVSARAGDLETFDGLMAAFSAGSAPFQKFVAANVGEEQIDFFVGMANELWEGSVLNASPENLFVQIPAFMISELTAAFRIGFILFLPFIAIDLAVTVILMALGMQMVQPNIISTPFKLLLFIVVSGWQKLAEGLLLSYAYS